MRQKNNQQIVYSMGVTLLLLGIIIATASNAAPLDQTTLEIASIKGGFGKVSVTVKNIGNETAENITMCITVKGGLLGRVNLTKICTGCGNCTNSILPNGTKTENTAEAGRIIGFGPLTITTSAEASNAPKVEKTSTGFILGVWVIVTQ